MTGRYRNPDYLPAETKVGSGEDATPSPGKWEAPEHCEGIVAVPVARAAR